MFSLELTLGAQRFLNSVPKHRESNNPPKETTQTPRSIWRPPRPPYAKINSDVAFNNATDIGFVGIVSRNKGEEYLQL